MPDFNWCDFDRSAGQSNGARFAALLRDYRYNLLASVRTKRDADEEITAQASLDDEVYLRLVQSGIIQRDAAYLRHFGKRAHQ